MNENVILLNNKTLLIDNKKWSYTVIQLCEELSISIPRFCYHRELSIVGNCRMCMVELKNSVKPIIACATSLNKNMQIFTNSELVKIARGNVLEFLLINHPLDCPICDQGGECDLQDQAFLYGSDKSRFMEYKRSVEDKNFGPIIKTVMSRCIHCTRCVRFAEEIIGVFSLGTMGRGKEIEISTYDNSILQHEMIGNIADICPVGALLIKPIAFKARTWDLENLDLLDIFDSMVGTASMGVKGNEVLRVVSRRNDNLNREWITDRIRFFYEETKFNRLLYPLVKLSDKLIHTSLMFVCNLYVNKMKNGYLSKDPLVGFVGQEVNYLDGFLISHFTNSLNIFCSSVKNIKKYINNDLRQNFLLNSSISNFINKNNILFVNVNLKLECSILNALLYKNVSVDNIKKVYYIGSIFKNSYHFEHVGLSSITLKKIQKGQYYFSTNLINNEFNWVESGSKPLFYFVLSNYLNSLVSFVKMSNMSYIANDSTEINLLEMGLESVLNNENFEDKNFYIVHFFGNFDIGSLGVFGKNMYKIYFSHYMPSKNVDYYNIFLPTLNFHEWSPNTSGVKAKMWLNNQLMVQTLFDHVITDVGRPESYYSYFYLFYYFLSKNFLLEDFLMVVKKYWVNVDLNGKYLNNYVSSFILSLLFPSFFMGIKSSVMFGAISVMFLKKNLLNYDD